MARLTWYFRNRGRAKVEDFCCYLLMDYIREQGGHITLHDKSLPKRFYDTFGVSKKTFKKQLAIYTKTSGIAAGKWDWTGKNSNPHLQ